MKRFNFFKGVGKALLTCSAFMLATGLFAQGAQETSVAAGVQAPAAPQASSAAQCVIENIQGGIASGSLSIFATEGNAMHTLFDPSGTGDAGDPGCFITQPYPYTVDSVRFNIGDASLFLASGTGTYEFVVKVLESTDSDGCLSPGAATFTSETMSIEMDDSGFHPVTVAVDESFSGPFFVTIETVSWDGPATSAPSAVLWDGAENNPCRQYVVTDGGDTVTDFQDYFTEGLTGWNNVVVFGQVPDQTGDVDVAVNSVTGTDPQYEATVQTTIEADVENLGDVDLVDIPVSLMEDGTEVGGTTVSLLSGEAETVSIDYTPSEMGDFDLTVEANAADDVDDSNNSGSLSITVMPAPGCLVVDDIEDYTSGDYVGPQSDAWTCWAGEAAEGTDADAFVSSDQAFSGANSVVFENESTDVLLDLGMQDAGTWETSMYLYFPADKGGYLNLQKGPNPGDNFAYELAFGANGTATLDYAGTSADFSFPQGEWFEFKTVIDLDSGAANLSTQGVLRATWDFSLASADGTESPTTISGIDFFPSGAPEGDEYMYYVDDVAHCEVYNNDPCSAAPLATGLIATGDNTDATIYDPELVGDCWGDASGVDGDVWYQTMIPEDGDYIVTTDLDVLGNDDTQLTIYTSDDNTCNGVLAQMGCSEDANPSAFNFLSIDTLEGLSAGDILFIQVDGYSGTSGDFQIEIMSMAELVLPDNDLCADAASLDPLLGGAVGEPQTSDSAYTNVNASLEGNEPTPADSCFFQSDPLQAPVWFTFTGDGGTYTIGTTDCNGDLSDTYLGDTQMLIGTGGCGDNFEAVVCNDDGEESLASSITMPTEEGVTYYILVDGYNGGMGEFCMSFDATSGIQELDRVGLNVYPNPASSRVNFTADENMEQIRVMNTLGQVVLDKGGMNTRRTSLDVSNLSKGIYLVNIKVNGEVYTTRLSRQ